jgi:rhamnogalacturonyl hydrolase YesR
LYCVAQKKSNFVTIKLGSTKEFFENMNIRKTMLFLVLILQFITSSAHDKIIDIEINRALSISMQQALNMYKSIKDQAGKLPRTINNKGELVCSNDKWWTSGFYPGTLWYLYSYAPNDSLKYFAENITNRVINQQYTKDNHDVGFMIYCSFGNGYKLTQNAAYKKVIINAAHSLSTRFNPITGCIKSWDKRVWEYPVIIDNMMNLELLCEATRLSGDSSFARIAISHADTTMKYHFRPDGSSYHVVNYDTINGGYKQRVTSQGAFDESSWARGQAWGLYGYTMMYRETKKPAYLKHAMKIADFILNHKNLPADKIPYWDFDAPNIPNELRDASAGAIMASAFIELSDYVDSNVAQNYLEIAKQQIKTLSTSDYLAKEGENTNFILKHSVGFMAKNSEVDVPLTYADYYYVEALLRLKKVLKEKK